MSWEAIGALGRELRLHEGFDDAVYIYTRDILAFRTARRDISKIIGKGERYRAFLVLIGLSLASDLRRDVGVSFSLFHAHCTQSANVSDRTARTVLKLAVYYGYVTVVGDPADRRARFYVPTERLRAFAVGWLEPPFNAFPALGIRSPFESERYPVAQATYLSAMRDYFDGSLYFYTEDPDFRRIFSLAEGGSVTCMAVLAAACDGRRGPRHRQIAESFGLSRPQVSRVVYEARRAGFFREDAELRPTERLSELYSVCISLVLAFLVMHAPGGALHQNGQIAAAKREQSA